MVEKWGGAIAQLHVNKDLSAIAGKQNTPSIADVSKAFDNETAINIISKHLLSLCVLGDATLKPEQFFDSALLIASEYYYLSLSELSLFFRRAKLGFYGQLVWGVKLNIQQVMTALFQFSKDRKEAIVQRETEITRKTPTPSTKTRLVFITQGIDRVRDLNSRAKSDYNAFRELFPCLPSDRNAKVYWRAWRIKEKQVGKYLCEYNINKMK